MLMILAFSIFGVLFLDSIKAGILIFISVLLVVGVYIGGDKGNKDTTYVSTKTNIYSLKDTNPNISGSFFLGNGIIKSEPMYSMFVDGEEGSKKKYFVSANALIFEGKSSDNYHEKIECIAGSYYDFLMGARMDKADCEFKVKNKLYVPKGTITNKFSI